MNIFKVLSSNDGSINEPNVSSFLAYLLDPNENHGLGSRFVERFLSPVILRNEEHYKELLYNNRVRDLSRNSSYDVRVQAEVKVVSFDDGSRRKTRDIDILIEIFRRDHVHSTPVFSFCIENKIKDGAIVTADKQLYEEIVGLRNYYDTPLSDLAQPRLSFIFLTPAATKRAEDQFNDLLLAVEQEGWIIPCFHMLWGIDERGGVQHTVTDVLTELLKEEAIGRIEPVYDYTKHTIKSFISFIYSGFQSYKEEKSLSNEKSDYGKPVIQYIKDFYDAVDSGTDIEHEKLKRWVKDKIQAASGLIIKNANFDNSYIVNDRNRRHYGVNSPFKMEKNLFYYPEEANKKLIRKLDITNPPAGVMIYWKDSESPDGVGRALLTDVWKDHQIEGRLAYAD